MVVTLFPAALLTGREQESTAAPSTCTVHAPHKPAPHPNFVPVRPSASRSTQSSGVSGATSSACRTPFTTNSMEAMLLRFCPSCVDYNRLAFAEEDACTLSAPEANH